jgi:hypothetical protein
MVVVASGQRHIRKSKGKGQKKVQLEYPFHQEVFMKVLRGVARQTDRGLITTKRTPPEEASEANISQLSLHITPPSQRIILFFPFVKSHF